MNKMIGEEEMWEGRSEMKREQKSKIWRERNPKMYERNGLEADRGVRKEEKVSHTATKLEEAQKLTTEGKKEATTGKKSITYQNNKSSKKRHM